MFTGEAKKVIWRTARRTVRKLFMNNARRGSKKGHLANISTNCSRAVHEQCSPRLQNRSFGEQFGELFASCSPNFSPKCTAIFGIENRKITVSTSHYGTVRYTINNLNMFYAIFSVRYGTSTVQFVYGTV